MDYETRALTNAPPGTICTCMCLYVCLDISVYMCKCIHVCMSVYICTYACVCIHMYLFFFYIWTGVYICEKEYVIACMLWVNMRMHVYIYICVCVCVYVYAYGCMLFCIKLHEGKMCIHLHVLLFMCIYA